VFKAAISEDILASILHILNEEDASADLILRVLDSLKQIQSFAFTIQMLPEDAQVSLRNSLIHLRAKVSSPEEIEKVVALGKDYSVSL
jgi:hypothetical protein